MNETTHIGGGMQEALRSGRFVITAEVTPPVSAAAADVLAKALPLQGLPDAVNVTDAAGARTHMGALAAAVILHRQGIEPILQIACRDRNRLALQGDLLGAAALGVRNLLLLRGDDPANGDQPETKPVFDLDTRSLLETARRMRDQGTLPTGRALIQKPDFLLGVADSPVDPAPGWRPDGLASKIASGAQFAQTQFCMDAGVVRRYMARLLEYQVPQRLHILIGIAPLKSARSARWMQAHLFGTIIPESVVRRLEQARDPQAEGRFVCLELIEEFATIPGVAGVHVMAPNNAEAIPEVIGQASRLRQRRAPL